MHIRAEVHFLGAAISFHSSFFSKTLLLKVMHCYVKMYHFEKEYFAAWIIFLIICSVCNYSRGHGTNLFHYCLFLEFFPCHCLMKSRFESHTEIIFCDFMHPFLKNNIKGQNSENTETMFLFFNFFCRNSEQYRKFQYKMYEWLISFYTKQLRRCTVLSY